MVTRSVMLQCYDHKEAPEANHLMASNPAMNSTEQDVPSRNVARSELHIMNLETSFKRTISVEEYLSLHVEIRLHTLIFASSDLGDKYSIARPSRPLGDHQTALKNPLTPEIMNRSHVLNTRYPIYRKGSSNSTKL